MIITVILALGLSCTPNSQQVHVAGGAEILSLEGTWSFRMDPESAGREQKWFQQNGFEDAVTLPGSMTENGYGYDVTAETEWTGSMWNNAWKTDDRYAKYRQPGNVKISFWLQPLKHYVGPAWYHRNIAVPDAWGDKQLTLHLERCHWETAVWVDGNYVSTKNSLSTPNRFRVGNLSPGEHTITICVDNSVKLAVGQDAHGVSDNTQTNWNGIAGAIRLEARDAVEIADLQIFPDMQKKQAVVRGIIRNGDDVHRPGYLLLDAQTVTGGSHDPAPKEHMIDLAPGENSFDLVYSMGEGFLMWDEFDPNVYRMSATVTSADAVDAVSVSFGMRELKTDGTRFILNGRPVFFRGTLECAVFPLTGYPPASVKAWERIIKTARSYGLNHIRFHSWCPPEAAFDAADKLGFYFQAEGPFWSTVGEGGELDTYIYDECDRILKEYGNHPSFVLMAYGNEPGGTNQNRFLGQIQNYWRSKDRRRLYTSASGWPHIQENEYHVSPDPRIQLWGAQLNSRINAKPPETVTDYRDYAAGFDVPVISHEIGQWCVYPDFREMRKYTGVTRPENFKIYRETLEANNMLDQARDFFMASGKLQTLCYKEDIESALRTPGFGGFQLLGLNDFPGQGTALVGVVDPFWEGKEYVTAREYHRFACETVPLARLKKRIWTDAEIFTAAVEIAHFGKEPLRNAEVVWKLIQGQNIYASGSFLHESIPVGNGIKLGTVEADLHGITRAAKLRLVAGIRGTEFENDWDVWVYPETVNTDLSGIHLASTLDETALDVLKAGGRVMLIPDSGSVAGDVGLGFSSIFWNTAWTNGQKPHTLGILCDPEHPALTDFPAEYHSNWQWWDMVFHGQAMIMDELPPNVRPIVQVVDDWFTNRRLGLLFEAEVAGGKLLVCSIDLRTDLDQRPVARQMLFSLQTYMTSDEFVPEHHLEVQQINKLVKKASKSE